MKGTLLPPACLLACLLLQMAAWGQAITARLDLSRHDAKPDFAEYSPADKGIVTLGPTYVHSSRYVGVVKYDKDFRREWAKQILEQNGRRNVEFLAVVGQAILVFTSEFQPQDNLLRIAYYRLSLAGELQRSDETLALFPQSDARKADLEFVLSPNKRRLLCYRNPDQKRASETLLFYSFDETGENDARGEFALPYPDNKFNIRTLRVSNQGNLYLLGRVTLAARASEPPRFVLYRHETRAQSGREIPINLDDRLITDLSFSIDRDENIYLGGFYSNQGSDRMIGTIYRKISPQDVLLVDAAEEFSRDFLANYLSDVQIARGKELRNFFLNDVVLRSDGSALILAEKFYVTQMAYRDVYGFTVNQEIYHYDDVILTSVRADGSIEWNAIVEKEQSGQNRSLLSYFDAYGADKAFIFYEYRPGRGNSLNVYYNTVDIAGAVAARRPLLEEYRFGSEFLPRLCEQINSREMLLMYYRNRGRELSALRIALE